MKQQLSKNTKLEDARLACEALGNAVEAALVNKDGVKVTRHRDTSFTVESSTERLAVSAREDGSIEFYFKGRTEPQTFLPRVDGGRINLTHRDESLTIEEAMVLLLTPFLYSRVNAPTRVS